MFNFRKKPKTLNLTFSSEEKVPAFNDQEHAKLFQFSDDIDVLGLDDPRLLPMKTLKLLGEENAKKINSISSYPITDRYLDWLKSEGLKNSPENISRYIFNMTEEEADKIWQEDKFYDLYDIFTLPFSILLKEPLDDNKLHIMLSAETCNEIEEILSKQLKIDKDSIYVPKYVMNLHEIEDNIYSIENLIENHKGLNSNIRYMGLEYQNLPKGVNLVLLSISVAIYKTVPRVMDQEYLHNLMYEDETMVIFKEDVMAQFEKLLTADIENIEEVAMLTNCLADIVELEEITNEYFTELEKALKKQKIGINKINV